MTYEPTIILYAAKTQLTPQHVKVETNTGDWIYVRALTAAHEDLDDALFEAGDRKLEGEVVLNTVYGS